MKTYKETYYLSKSNEIQGDHQYNSSPYASLQALELNTKIPKKQIAEHELALFHQTEKP